MYFQALILGCLIGLIVLCLVLAGILIIQVIVLSKIKTILALKKSQETAAKTEKKNETFDDGKTAEDEGEKEKPEDLQLPSNIIEEPKKVQPLDSGKKSFERMVVETYNELISKRGGNTLDTLNSWRPICAHPQNISSVKEFSSTVILKEQDKDGAFIIIPDRENDNYAFILPSTNIGYVTSPSTLNNYIKLVFPEQLFSDMILNELKVEKPGYAERKGSGTWVKTRDGKIVLRKS